MAVANVILEEPSHAAEMPPPRSRHSSDRRSQLQAASEKASGSRRSGQHLEEATRGIINETRNSDPRTNSQQAYESVAGGSSGNRMKVNINNQEMISNEEPSYLAPHNNVNDT